MINANHNHNEQRVNVTVITGRRRHWFPLIGFIGFVLAFFWPLGVFHGVFAGIAEVLWLLFVGGIWALVFAVRAVVHS